MKPSLPYTYSRIAPDGVADATADEARAMASVWRRYAEQATREEDRAGRLEGTEWWERYRVPREAPERASRPRGVRGDATDRG